MLTWRQAYRLSNGFKGTTTITAMGGLSSTFSSTKLGFLPWVRRNRTQTQRQQPCSKYTNVSTLDLTMEGVSTDDMFVDTLQACPQQEQVRILSLCGQAHITMIPSAIGRFKDLETLNLSDNQIESVTWAIVYLKKLKVLDLSYNMLTALPRTIGHLSELMELYLQANHLTTLPTELLMLTKLSILDVSKNEKFFCKSSKDKTEIFNLLTKRKNRQDMWEGSTPWVGGNGQVSPPTISVASLHEMCVQQILTCKIDYLSPQFIPPVMKTNLSEVEGSYRNRLNLAKCSNCKSYFSTKDTFDRHLC